MQDKKIIIEVKPYEKAQKEDFLLRTKCVEPILQQEGYEYRVLTEREIRREPRATNIKLLAKYANTRLHYQHQIVIFGLFKNREAIVLRELVEHFASTGIGQQLTLAFIYYGLLKIDFNKKLESDSLVYIPSVTIRGDVEGEVNAFSA